MHTFIYAIMWTYSLFAFSKATVITTPIDKKEVVIKVHDLPNTNEFAIEDNHYLDLALRFTEYNLFGILPLWIIEEPKLGGYDEIDHKYYEIPEENLNFLLKEQNLNRSKLESPPFYHRYGGKIVVVVFFIILINGGIATWRKL